jgi:hypothetical protein
MLFYYKRRIQYNLQEKLFSNIKNKMKTNGEKMSLDSMKVIRIVKDYGKRSLPETDSFIEE